MGKKIKKLKIKAKKKINYSLSNVWYLFTDPSVFIE